MNKFEKTMNFACLALSIAAFFEIIKEGWHLHSHWAFVFYGIYLVLLGVATAPIFQTRTVIERDPFKKKLSTELPIEMHQMLKNIARERRCTMTVIIIGLIAKFLEENNMAHEQKEVVPNVGEEI